MSVLKIHLTYQCTARCDHCRFGCTNEESDVIDHDLVLSCVNDLKKYNDLELVVLMGGEPGLFPDLTHSLTSEINKLDIAIRVETNAFWATSMESAYEFLYPLYSNNASVMLSLDSFHEPYVSQDCIERAIRTSDALNGRYNIETAYMDIQNIHHQCDIRTNELLKGMEDRLGRSPCCQIYKGNIFYNGRASVLLADEVSEGRGVPLDLCTEVPWWSNSSIETLELLELDPEGYLSKGCGIAFANVKGTPIKEIMAGYDARKHPIFSTLIESGPIGLAKEAVELGYVMKKDYADKCHLCQEVRNVLRIKYSDYLVPLQHYKLSKKAQCLVT